MKPQTLAVFAFAAVTLVVSCIEYNGPVGRHAVQGISWGVAIAVCVACIAVLFGLRRGNHLLAWLGLTVVMYVIVPDHQRALCFSAPLAIYGLGAGMAVLLGEMGVRPPRAVGHALVALILMGMFFVLPWAVMRWLLAEGPAIEDPWSAEERMRLTTANVVLWLGLKVVFPVVVSRMIDLRLARRAHGLLFRLGWRTAAIWSIDLLPWPSLFLGPWGELIVAGGMSSVIDGAWDVLSHRRSASLAIAGVTLGLATLLATPGVMLIYGAGAVPPSVAALITVAFVMVSCRAYSAMLAYGMIGSDLTGATPMWRG